MCVNGIVVRSCFASFSQASADAAVFCRGMRGDQARKVCPEVQLVQVPTAHGKADLTMYRDAGKKVRLLSF